MRRICAILLIIMSICIIATIYNNEDEQQIEAIHYVGPMYIVDTNVEEDIIEDIHFDNKYDEMIYQATKDTVIDPYLAIAISRLETGHYTSNAFVNGNNFGGMTGSDGVMSFSSLSDGLDRYVTMLEWYYDNNMDTPSKMQSTYCPPNEDWDNIVSSIYSELKQY